MLWPALAAPNAGVLVAPNPPNAGVLLPPKSGVLAAPKAGVPPNSEGLLCGAKVEALLAPKSEVVAPKAGVLLPTEKGLLKAIGKRLAPHTRARASLLGSDLFKK